MNPTSRKVGRITLAVALIGGGAVMVIDNLTGIGLLTHVARLWPALLIALGLEWVYVSRQIAPDDHGLIRLDGAATLCLVMVILFASGQPLRSARNRAVATRPLEVRPVATAPSRIDVRPAPTVQPGNSTLSAPVTSTQEPVVADLQHLTVSSGRAAISVEPGEQFRITLQVRAFGQDTVSAQRNATQARLNVAPGSSTLVGIDLSPEVRFADLALRVTIPPGVRLTLHSDSGDIAVAGYQGAVNAQSTSGSIEVERIDGPVELHASAGGVTARQINGDLTINTSSGFAEVANPSGTLSVRTLSGPIRVTTSQVGGEYGLHSASGTVRLELPTTAAVQVVAQTKSGTIGGPDWLMPGTKARSAAGTQGAGTHSVTIETSSGAIRIADRE